MWEPLNIRVPAGSIRTSCDVDLSDYPYDKQTCDIYFGSWSHSQEHINITTLGLFIEYWINCMNLLNIKYPLEVMNSGRGVFGIQMLSGMSLIQHRIGLLIYIYTSLFYKSLNNNYIIIINCFKARLWLWGLWSLYFIGYHSYT